MEKSTDAGAPSGLTQVDRPDEAWVICCLQASSVSKTSEDVKSLLEPN